VLFSCLEASPVWLPCLAGWPWEPLAGSPLLGALLFRHATLSPIAAAKVRTSGPSVFAHWMTGPSWKPLAAIPKLQPGALLF
jgi:hypothetical protein